MSTAVFDRLKKTLKRKNLTYKEIFSSCIVLYFLSRHSPGMGYEVRWKANNILFDFQERQKEHKKERQIIELIEHLDETNKTMVNTRGKILSVEEVERLSSLFAPDNTDYALMASVMCRVVKEIPKPAGLRIKAKDYLPEKAYDQLKEFFL